MFRYAAAHLDAPSINKINIFAINVATVVKINLNTYNTNQKKTQNVVLSANTVYMNVKNYRIGMFQQLQGHPTEANV